MQKKICFITAILFILNILSCDTTEPEKSNLEIAAEDVSCTEVWINVTGAVGSEMVLNRDDKEVKRFILISSPQIVYDDSLLPNKIYTYQASSIQHLGSSNRITAATLDTTSNIYTWQTFIFGGAASSYLSDVAIINENNIIVVGSMFISDSTGNSDPEPYCIAEWNGLRWELKKLFYDSNKIITAIRGIYSSNNNIYFAAGSIFQWDGTSIKTELIFSRLSLSNSNSTIEKLWGVNNSDIYGAGNSGTLVHYKNSSWRNIETGTETDISDIWGKENMVLFTGYPRNI